MAQCPDDLDVFVLIERDNMVWIGSACTADSALDLIRNYSLKQPGLFLVNSQKSGERSLHIAGLGDVRRVAERHLNLRSLC